MMFIKRDLFIYLVILAAAVIITGCGASMKDSGGDQTGEGDGLVATAQFVGLENCYTCHSQTKFRQWMDSRHANFDLEDGTRVNYATMETAEGGTPVTYAEITGDPDPHPDGQGGDSCAPCHTGPDLGGNILDTNYFGDVFVDPNLGQMARPIISCEACHGGGSFHYGVGALPYPKPNFERCAELCHDFNFDKEPPYGSHHYVDSNRYWDNATGDSARDADSDVTPMVADTTIAGVAFSVWSLPDPADTVWSGNYDGPYYFVPDRTIRDTHINAAWILNEDDQVTIFSVPTAKLGYVNLDNDSPNTGMVNADSPESCTASCHDPHTFDKTIQQQWADGAHHPTPEGPVLDEDGEPVASGPPAWHAVDHGGFSSSCQRCHTSMGFAEVAPGYGYGSATLTPSNSDGFITCNACHDGENYPTPANNRLRLDGTAYLFDNGNSSTGSPVYRLTIPDVGPSATCMYCHQGRESGLSVANAIASSDTHSFINRHYLAAAAILMGADGTAAYQYSGQSYAGPNTYPGHGDNLSLCVDCHLRGQNDHRFRPQVADCSACHTGITDFEDIALPSGNVDYDGDTIAESFHDEIQGMLAGLLGEIQTYAATVLSAPIVYSADGYPYFFNDTNADGIADPAEIDFGNRYQTFDDSLLAAAYNYHSGRDPCGPYHNYQYVIQSLYDSTDDLDNGLLDGSVQFNVNAAVRP